MNTGRTFCAVLLVVSAAGIFTTGCSDRSGQSHTEAGIRRLHQEQYQSAVKLFKEAISLNPENGAAHCNLGITYWRMGEYNKALDPFLKAAEINKEDPLPHEYRGLIYIELEDWDEARMSFYSALERNRDSAKIVTYLALVELRSGNTFKARMFLQRALEIDPVYAPALYNLAMLHSGEAPEDASTDDQINAARAAEYFEDYLDVADDETRKQKASRYLQKVRLESAVPHAEEEFFSQPTTPPAETDSGREPGPETEAEPETETAAEQQEPDSGRPEDIHPAILSVRKALADHEYDKALILLNEALDENPENSDLLWELAVVYDRHLEYKEKAKDVYRRFARLFPDDPRVKKEEITERTSSRSSEEDNIPRNPGEALEEWGKGLQFHEAGDIAEAINYYKKALLLDRKCFNAAYNLGIAYREKEQHKLAETALRQAVKIKPGKPRALYMLGLVQSERDKYRDAIENLNKALRLKPDYAQPHFVLGLVYHRKKRKDLARTHFRHCAELAEGKRLGKRAEEWLEFLGN